MFVWFQIFNQFNSCCFDNYFNIFEGIICNWFYIVINLIMIGGQVFIIFVGGVVFGICFFIGKEWGMFIGLGVIFVFWGILICKFFDVWVVVLIFYIKFFKFCFCKSKKKDDLEKMLEDVEVQKLKDIVMDSVSECFGLLLRMLISICGKWVLIYICWGFREYMYDKKM